MSLPTTLGAYTDCFEKFEEAPCRVGFATEGEANIFKLRMHQARVLRREESKRIYERTNPKWGISGYDKFRVSTPRESADGIWWVYIRPHASNILVTEPLEPDE